MSEEDGERALALAFPDREPDCKEEECWVKAKVKGYCSRHYQAARRKGKFGGAPCLEWPCEEVGVTRGLCSNHYYKARKEGGLGGVDRDRKPCPGDGPGDVCWGAVKARGMCNSHYVKWYRAEKRKK